MKIKIKIGKKNEYGDDYKLYLWADGEPVSFIQMLKLLNFFFNNEDRIYPPSKGFRGRGMLVDAICDLAQGMSIEEICQRYKLIPKSL